MFYIKDLERYQSQIAMIGIDGQEKIKNSSVLIVGLGGLGCPASLQLALAGIGTLGIMDSDVINLTNLHRQILYNEGDIGRNKVQIATKNLTKFNSHININPYDERLNEKNCIHLIKKYDYIIDASDNFACFFEKKPLISGSVFQFEGRLITFMNDDKQNSCLRCMQPLVNTKTQSCSDGGIIGMVTGIIGSMQAMEVIKLILKIGENSINTLTQFNALHNTIKKFKLHKDDNCELCGKNPTLKNVKIMNINCTTNDIKLTLQMDDFLKNPDEYCVVDVRTKEERIMDGIIDGDFWLQLDLLYQNPQELKKFTNENIVIYCHAGVRSLAATQFLKENGFKNVQSLDGGIKLYNSKKFTQN